MEGDIETRVTLRLLFVGLRSRLRIENISIITIVQNKVIQILYSTTSVRNTNFKLIIYLSILYLITI